MSGRLKQHQFRAVGVDRVIILRGGAISIVGAIDDLRLGLR
jgi:hypothetical protein